MTTLELPALLVHTVSAVTSAERLVVINRDPEPAETGVPLDTTIELGLVALGSTGLASDETLVFVNGNLAFTAMRSNGFSSEFRGRLSTAGYRSGVFHIVLHPVVPFASLATVTVRVVGQTTDGALLDTSYSFTVEDRTAPRLIAALAAGQRLVRIAFDEPVALPMGWGASIAPLSGPAVPVLVESTAIDGTMAELTLNTEMTADVQYEITVNGVADLFGNAILAPFDRIRFAGYRPPKPPGRRFELWDMLPKHNRRDDQTGDLKRFIACLQEVTDLLLTDIDRFPDIFDLERAPEGYLDCILSDLGNPFPFDLDTLGRRKLAALLVEMYRQKGTAKAIRNAVRFFLGIEISSISPINATTLVLGESELGVDWILGPSDRFALYAFNVEVPRTLTDTERRQLRAIVTFLRPAHTHFVDLLEPSVSTAPEYWELGTCELGVSTALD
jgi:phage tail-like protein